MLSREKEKNAECKTSSFEEPGARNPHATIFGSRVQVTAPRTRWQLGNWLLYLD